MHNANGKLVERFYEKLLTGDLEGVRQYLTPDTIIVEAESMPYGGTYRGFDGLCHLVSRFSEVWTDSKVRLRQCIADAEHVVVILELSGCIKAQRIETSISELWTFQDGMPRSVDVYYFDTKKIADAVAA